MGDLTPVFSIAYGDSGVGKSTDQLLAFPTAWFLCLKGADKPGYQFGIRPTVVVVSTLADVVVILQHIQAMPVETRPPAVIVDDLTLLAERTYAVLRVQYPKSQTFAFWDSVKAEVHAVRDLARVMDIHVLCSAHAVVPDIDQNDQYHKGGPTMPGRKMRSAIPHMADEVYMCELEPGREPWPGVYRCEPDPEWHMKSRLGLIRAPMNIRELWRRRGYVCPRLPGQEWQDGVADTVAAKIIGGGEPWIDIWNRAEVQLTAKGIAPGLVYWALRDGVDRATLAKSHTLLGRFQPSDEKKE